MNKSIKSASIVWSAFLFALVFFPVSLKAQNTEELFRTTNDTLLTLFKKIRTQPLLIDEVNAANEKILSTLENFLNQNNAFDFHFKAENNLSDLISSDKNTRIITWVLPPFYGIYRSYGLIVLLNKKTKTTNVFRLQHNTEKPAKPEHAIHDYTQWESCVYYKMLERKFKKKTYYTLLGWSGNDGITSKKLIDVLTIENGKPVFGAPVFQLKKQKQSRLIFEYNAQAVMKLNYDEQKKMIVFDHLSPDVPVNTGRFQYYGPDFSVDGLIWKKGFWILQEDIDAKNKN